MEKLGETKNQHYVPRFILRKFSKDERRISLVTLSNGRRVDGASIAGQCKADYFYGSDQLMEKSFQAEETKISKYLSTPTIPQLDSLPASAYDELLAYVHYQQARTRGAAEHLSTTAGAFAKSMLRDHIRLNRPPNIRNEDLDLVEIGIKNAQHESIWFAAKTLPLMRDMVVKFIITDRPVGFVIADHPVVAYNQFAEHHTILRQCPTSTELAHKGLQLFMPISPSVTLAIYDPGTYEYGGKSRICRAGPQDVTYLNEMQTINAWECIYFHTDRVDKPTLDSLLRARKNHPSRYKKTTSESELTRRPDGKLSKFTVVTYVDIRIGAKLSFIRSTDGHSYEYYQGSSVPVRSPERVAFTEAYGNHLEKIVADRRAASTAEAERGPSEATTQTNILESR